MEARRARCANHLGNLPPHAESEWGALWGAATQEIKLYGVDQVKNKGSQNFKCNRAPWDSTGRRDLGGGGEVWMARGLKFYLLLLRLCVCFHSLLSPNSYGAHRWQNSGEWRGTKDIPLPAPTFLINILRPWFHACLTQGFMSHFQWNVTFGQTAKKSPHYKLGNVWKENYLPKAALNQCCPNIYLAHTRRSCVNVCQRM